MNKFVSNKYIIALTKEGVKDQPLAPSLTKEGSLKKKTTPGPLLNKGKEFKDQPPGPPPLTKEREFKKTTPRPLLTKEGKQN